MIPDADHYVCPKEALKKIRNADNISQTIYIYGAAGFGKTSLIKYYLQEKEYYYFSAEELTQEDLKKIRMVEGKETKRKIVVIDDLSVLWNNPEGSVIKQQINELSSRDNIWLILIGRGSITSWLRPIYLKKIFAVIDETDLQFKESELIKFFSLYGIQLTDQEMELFLSVVSDMPAAIVAKITAIEYLREKHLDQQVMERARIAYWDYLEYHVYNLWDVEIQEFFMKMSIVSRFDIHLAEMITGRTDVAKILCLAKEIGNFVAEVNVCMNEVYYEVRVPVQRSMKRRLYQQYSNEQRRILYNNAGLYYELSNRPMDALKMYEACDDVEHISNLLISNARMNPGNGHFYELKKYYLAMPEERIRSKPELMAGMSMLQAILMNIDESERWYEELKKSESILGGSIKKSIKCWLLYLDIALPHRGSDDLIHIFKNSVSLLANRTLFLPELSVTSNLPSMMNGGKDFCEWSKKDTELARTIGKMIEFALGKSGKGFVDLALAESYFEKGMDSYEVSMLASRGKMKAEAGGKIEQCFVGTGILVWNHLINQHAPEALEMLENFYEYAKKENAEKLLPSIETMIVRLQMYVGNINAIEEWMQTAPKEDNEFCIMERFRYLTKVRGYLRSGKNEQAYQLLQKLLYYADIMKRTYVRIESKLLYAITLYRLKSDMWDEVLQEAMTEAQEYHFVRIISREGAAIDRLLHETKWKPKDDSFFKQVLVETKRMAQGYPGYLRVVTQEVVLGENAIRILKMQAEGYSIAEIAESLDLQIETIKYHNKQTYKKLGVKGKTAAVMEAKKRNII